MGEQHEAVEAHEPEVGREGYDMRCPSCGEREVCRSVLGGLVCMACGWATRMVTDDNSQAVPIDG